MSIPAVAHGQSIPTCVIASADPHAPPSRNLTDTVCKQICVYMYETMCHELLFHEGEDETALYSRSCS